MSYKIISILMYTIIFISLITIDYFLGHGLKKAVCAIFNRYVIENFGTNEIPTFPNVRLLLTEILIIILTTIIIKTIKRLKPVENTLIEELLTESNDLLIKTNKFLEKLRQLRTEVQNRNEQNGDSLEIPILRMAIFETQGALNYERGEAGDANFMETTILSMTSLVDDETLSELSEKSMFNEKPIGFANGNEIIGLNDDYSN